MKIEYFRPYYTLLGRDELIYKDKISTKDPYYYVSHDENVVNIRRFPNPRSIAETYLRDFNVVKKQGLDYLNEKLKTDMSLTMDDVCDFSEGLRYKYYSFDSIGVERWGENDKEYVVDMLSRNPDLHKNLRGVKRALIAEIKTQLKNLENLKYEDVVPFGNH